MAITDTAHLRFSNSQTLATLNRVEGVSQLNDQEDKKLREACKDFESLLIKQMLDAMKKTVPESNLIDKNQGEKYFEDMLYQEYADSMADTESLGISDMMYRQLTIHSKGDLY